jgi:hypothetical protein
MIMNFKLSTLMSITAVSCVLISQTVRAENLNYNYLQVSMIEQSVEGVALDPSGFRLTGSYLFDDIAYLKVNYASSDDDEALNSGKRNIDITNYFFGIGIRQAFNESTDWYVELASEKVSNDIVDKLRYEDESKFSYSGALGIRSVQFGNLELEATVKHLYNKDGSEFSTQIGALYDVSSHVSIGIDYEFGADIDTLAAVVRYNF